MDNESYVSMEEEHTANFETPLVEVYEPIVAVQPEIVHVVEPVKEQEIIQTKPAADQHTPSERSEMTPSPKKNQSDSQDSTLAGKKRKLDWRSINDILEQRAQKLGMGYKRLRQN